MSQGKLAGSNSSGMSPSGSSPIQGIGASNLPGGTAGGMPSPVTSAIFGKSPIQQTNVCTGASNFGVNPTQPVQPTGALTSGPVAPDGQDGLDGLGTMLAGNNASTFGGNRGTIV